MLGLFLRLILNREGFDGFGPIDGFGEPPDEGAVFLAGGAVGFQKRPFENGDQNGHDGDRDRDQKGELPIHGEHGHEGEDEFERGPDDVA